jgi:hypothetical protein
VNLWRRVWLWLCLAATVLGVAAVAGAPVAAADDGTGAGTDLKGEPLIAWMGIKDSHGAPVAQYTLSLNHGSFSDPVAKVFAEIDGVLYESFLIVATTALWLIKKVMSFDWLNIFAVPFTKLSHAVDAALAQTGLATAALAVLGIVAGLAMLSGKVAKGASQIGMGLLIVALAATVFAHPMARLTGPNGWLANGRDDGLRLASMMAGDRPSEATAEANVDNMVALLADRFIRIPTQLINYGRVSDSVSRECADAFSRSITDGRGDKAKDDLGNCDKRVGKKMHDHAMANPASILVGLNLTCLIAVFLIAFAGYFGWKILRCAMHAMMYAAMTAPAMAIGVIPGGLQSFAWKTAIDLALSYLAMVFYAAFLGGYIVVLKQIYDGHDQTAAPLFITALALVLGIAAIGPVQKVLERQRDTWATKLGQTPAHASSGGAHLLTKALAAKEAADTLGKLGRLLRRPKRITETPAADATASQDRPAREVPVEAGPSEPPPSDPGGGPPPQGPTGGRPTPPPPSSAHAKPQLIEVIPAPAGSAARSRRRYSLTESA